jgi:hypothetical protein
MDKKTTILYGVLGAAFVGGIIYYSRAKKLQTDVISALKIDLQNAGIQLPTLTPVSGTQVPKPNQLPTSTTPIRTQSSPIRTSSSSQQVGNEVKAPRFGEYGQPSNQTYGQPNTQVGQDFGSANQYGGELIFDTGAAGYGGDLLYDTGGTGYGGNILYDTGSSEYGGDTIFDTGASQYLEINAWAIKQFLLFLIAIN